MSINTNFEADVIAYVEGLHATEKVELSRAIAQNGLKGGEITDRHVLETDVQTGDPIIIYDNRRNYKAFAAADPTSCELNECELDLNFSLKKWMLGLYNCRVPICMKSFSKDFLKFLNTHYQVLHDLTLEEQFIVFFRNKFEDNMIGAAWRVGYFADESILAADPNFDLLKDANGFFTQAEAGDGIKYTFNQTNPTGEDIYNALEIAYNDYMLSDWSAQKVVWKMTRTMAAGIVRWLNGLKDRSAYNCECFSADGITAMRTFTLEGTLTLFGIPVHIESDLDGVIKDLTLTHPYRALLTPESNLQIGTQKTEDIKRFDIWYDKKNRNVYMDGEIYLGAAMPLDEYVYVGAETASTP